jgi:hypothetical protein
MTIAGSNKNYTSFEQVIISILKGTLWLIFIFPFKALFGLLTYFLKVALIETVSIIFVFALILFLF